MLIKPLLLLFTLSISHYVNAQEITTPKGLEYCTVCHGSQLKGNANIGAPRLSGLPQWYLERQLTNFKQGIRGAHSEDVGGTEMRMMAANLTSNEISAIAAWVAKTNSDKPKPTLSADTAAGKALYQSCVACHGQNGEGNEAIGAPKLNGLNDWYLATQLNHFRLNLRGSQSNDTYGQQMKAASVMLSSNVDAENLAAYIITLPNQSE